MGMLKLTTRTTMMVRMNHDHDHGGHCHHQYDVHENQHRP